MRFGYKLGVILLALVASVGILAGCSESNSPTAEEQAEKAQKESYANGVAEQPPYIMKHFPGRETLNTWAENMDDPNKPVFIYLFDAEGDQMMYFVSKGPPVSYCASMGKPQKIETHWSSGNVFQHAMPAPAQDGLYYTAGNCAQMIAVDYTTDQIVEWTSGGSFNQIVLESPAEDPLFENFPQGGPTSVEEVQKQSK